MNRQNYPGTSGDILNRIVMVLFLLLVIVIGVLFSLGKFSKGDQCPPILLNFKNQNKHRVALKRHAKKNIKTTLSKKLHSTVIVKKKLQVEGVLSILLSEKYLLLRTIEKDSRGLFMNYIKVYDIKDNLKEKITFTALNTGTQLGVDLYDTNFIMYNNKEYFDYVQLDDIGGVFRPKYNKVFEDSYNRDLLNFTSGVSVSLYKERFAAYYDRFLRVYNGRTEICSHEFIEEDKTNLLPQVVFNQNSILVSYQNVVYLFFLTNSNELVISSRFTSSSSCEFFGKHIGMTTQFIVITEKDWLYIYPRDNRSKYSLRVKFDDRYIKDSDTLHMSENLLTLSGRNLDTRIFFDSIDLTDNKPEKTVSIVNKKLLDDEYSNIHIEHNDDKHIAYAQYNNTFGYISEDSTFTLKEWK